MEKKSFQDYLKIIKEENEIKEEIKNDEKTIEDDSKDKLQELKKQNKVVLEKIKSEKPKKEKKKFKCPPETSDVALNLANRQKAIDEFGYGPLNPLEENKKFWEEKVEKWRLDSTEEAKKSVCGNCSAFVITKNMLDCIAKGLSGEDSSDSWGAIEAGQLGYCEALDFKCSALRTCNAWIVGGPITDEKTNKE
jgi:hypothetical protein